MTAGNTLILKEFQTARIGDEWNSSERMISHRKAAWLNLFQNRTGAKLFDVYLKKIKSRNWVGSIGIGNKSIEVVPKIDRRDEKGARENLLVMLSRSGLVPLTEAEIARLAEKKNPLIVAYMNLFVDKLTLEWRRGRIRYYVLQEYNRPFLRGKLLVGENIKRNFFHRERFYTAFDEFIEDNEYSRILKAALSVCLDQRMSEAVSRKSRSLMPDFHEVSGVVPEMLDLDNITISRQFERFRPLLNMAKIILRSISPSFGGRGDQVYSLMFDMNKVFERYIAREVRDALRDTDLHSRTQLRSRHLLTKEGSKKFLLKPDIGIYKGKEIRCLIDTKWKTLQFTQSHKGVSQSDIYQMYAYGKQYDAPVTILLYPRCGKQEACIADYEHIFCDDKGDDNKKLIQIRTIDISRSLIYRGERERLREELRALIIQN